MLFYVAVTSDALGRRKRYCGTMTWGGDGTGRRDSEFDNGLESAIAIVGGRIDHEF